MKYCERCGAELEENMRYCGQCGARVSQEEEAPRDYWAERLNRPGEAMAEPEGTMEPDCCGEEPDCRETEEDFAPEPPSCGDAEEPPHRGEARIRRLWAMVSVLSAFVAILAAVLIFFLCFKKDPPAREIYYGRSCTVGKEQYTGEGDWISLCEDGTAELFLLNSGAEGSWSQQGENLTLNCGSQILTGTLRNGVLTLESGDLHFLLAREDVPLFPLEGAEDALPTSRFTGWEGDYYGWWRVSQAWGQWEDTQGEAWDVCGRIWMEGDELGKLELWDTQCLPGELLAAADIAIRSGTTDAGCLESLEGQFCEYPLQQGDWLVDPAREPYSQAPGMLILTGLCGDGENGFAYEIFLRPWGSDWEEVEDFTCSLLPEKKRLPPLYRKWYQPRLTQGGEMPETFFGEEP